jgi:hypothetical protein
MASLGSTPGLIVAAGVGAAAATALAPAFEVPQQDAWSRLPNRILNVGTLASLVAQGGVLLGNANGATAGSAYGEARRQGYSADKLDRLVWLALRAPDLSLTLEMWRRGLFGEPTGPDALKLVDHALAKEQIEPQYWPFIKELFAGRLDPALVAVMVQRSVLPNATDPVSGELILPAQPSTTGSNVPPMPQIDLDPILEARAHGIDFQRLAAEARIVGLPASADLAARMHFRSIITEGAYNQAILEGNTRGEWAPFLLDGFREILTAGEYAELELRGFLTPAERLAETDKHGMSKADSDLLYNLLGRSIPEHQITTGEARGGVFDGPWDTIPKAYLQSLQRGNLRPEYYNLAYHNRYSLPSAFVLRSITTGGEITQEQAHQLLLEIGWPPWLAETVSAAWAPQGAVAKLNPWVKAQQTRLVSAMHKAATKTGVLRSELEPYLTPLVPDLADRDAIFQLWADERAVAALTG